METQTAAAPATRRPSFHQTVRRPAAVPSEVRSPAAPDVYAVSTPAGLFTGDFYHLARRPDGLWLAVGDVAGHGLDSAIFMAMIQEILEERLADAGTGSPAGALASIHEALTPELPVHRFVSLVLGHLATDGRLRLANAGHCPPLLLRRGGAVLKIPSHGAVLHPFAPPGWEESSFRLEVGEKLVLYTDGVSESPSPAGEELGIDGVARAAAGSADRDARAVADALLGAAARFRAGAPPPDDLTVMVVGRRR